MVEEDAVQQEEKEEKEEVKPKSKVESAFDAVEKLRAENERMEKNIAKIEELKAVEILSGKTDAAEKEPEKKEESPQEYKNRILAGNK